MKKFSKILVCTDFSAAGNRAVKAAFGLAAGMNAEVLISHVLDAPPAANPLYAHYYPANTMAPENLEKAREKALEELRNLVSEEGRRAVASVDFKVCSGEVVEEILKLAREMPADAVVVGTRGHARLASMLLGSVADRVVRQAPCPVMVVR